MNRRLLFSIVLSLACFSASIEHSQARLFHLHKKQAVTKSRQKTAKAKKQPPPQKPPQAAAGATDDSSIANPSSPVLTPPSSLVDITSARFGKLDIDLRSASFLEASVADLHLTADHMDLTAGTLNSLGISVLHGEFQDFTVDDLEMSTQGALHFDTGRLFNDKVLQFLQPANAQVHVSITQNSLNQFLNSPEVLARLSGSARKRVPILSTLARQDVNFGFSFLKANLELQPDNHVRLSMDSKLGMGKRGMPVAMSAETQLTLEQGWVNLANTTLSTGGTLLPKDLSKRIVSRINNLSKWGSKSDDIHFWFTDLKVLPDDRIELSGTAEIRRLRFGRQDNQPEQTEMPKLENKPETAPTPNQQPAAPTNSPQAPVSTPSACPEPAPQNQPEQQQPATPSGTNQNSQNLR